jgi:hypothetical protein
MADEEIVRFDVSVKVITSLDMLYSFQLEMIKDRLHIRLQS